jgi:hypothetical protein
MYDIIVTGWFQIAYLSWRSRIERPNSWQQHVLDQLISSMCVTFRANYPTFLDTTQTPISDLQQTFRICYFSNDSLMILETTLRGEAQLAS